MEEIESLLQALDLAVANPAPTRPPPVDNGSIAALCERMANTLLGLGATGPAARWRTLSLVDPSQAELAAALEHTRRTLPGLDRNQPAPTTEEAQQARIAATVAGEAPLPEAGLVADWALRLVAAGESNAALSLLKRQAFSHGLRPEHCNAVASMLLRMEQWWEAERWLCTSLTHDRRQPRPWFSLARLLLQQGVLDEALEAVQQGLHVDPASNWGLNLRAHIVLANGGWRSYDHLAASDNNLPGDSSARLELHRARQRWRRRGFGRDAPSPLPLPMRLQLRRLLPTQGLVVLLHGHHNAPLTWLLEQEVLPVGATADQGLRVQPLASREPLVLPEQLLQAGFRTLPEQPATWMRQTASGSGATEAVELLIIQRPMGSSLPLALGDLLPRVKRLLTTVGLATPPQFTETARWNGWQLLIAAT